MSVQLSDNGVLPVARALEAKAASIRQGELKKAFGHLGRLSEDERDTIVALATAITDRILSLPLRRLDADHRGSYDGVLRALFGLDGEADQTIAPARKREDRQAL